MNDMPKHPLNLLKWPQLWHHLHNSFLFLEAPKKGLSPLDIQVLATTHHVDGVAEIEPPKSNSNMFNLTSFFNCDGSPAKYCGNAHTCLATLAWEHGAPEAKFGEYHMHTRPASEGRLCYQLKPFLPSGLCRSVSLPGGLRGFYLLFGVPHVILDISQSEKESLLSYQKFPKNTLLSIQNDQQFPQGVNVTFLLRNSQGHPCGSLSFERGLQSFSNACSSGIFACILYALEHRLLQAHQRFSWETRQDHLELQVEDESLLIYSKAHRIPLNPGEKL